jgi:hypothetical protein
LVLLSDEIASGSIALYAREYRTWYPAIGPLRTVLIKDIEQHEFSTSTRSRFSGHIESSYESVGATIFVLDEAEVPLRVEELYGTCTFH